MHYFGGPVISNAKLYVVWWGQPSSLDPSITAARGGMADFFAGVTHSNFMDWLNEYDTNIPTQSGSKSGSPGTGQHIGRGNLAGTYTLTSIPSGNVTDAQVQSTLDAAFASGALPMPDSNSLYAFFFPPSVSIDMDGASCGSWLAYHEYKPVTSQPAAAYIVMPDCGGGFDTTTVSHELAESITDYIPTPGSNPNYPQAWNTSDGNEVGDLCVGGSASVSTALGTFSVQAIWDEVKATCAKPHARKVDYSIDLPGPASLSAGVGTSFTLSSTTLGGSPQSLTLSVTGPAGVTASVSPSTITSGQAATVTVTWDGSTPVHDTQVVVEADGNNETGAQAHTAALLLQ
jgi:hypothetical protein